MRARRRCYRQSRTGPAVASRPATRCHPSRRSAVSMTASTRAVMPGTSTGRRPATWQRIQLGDLPPQGHLQAEPARVLPQYDEGPFPASFDSEQMYGGGDATGQSATAHDATASTHRRRNPRECVRRRTALGESAVPPVAVGHEVEPFVGAFAVLVRSTEAPLIPGECGLELHLDDVRESQFLPEQRCWLTRCKGADGYEPSCQNHAVRSDYDVPGRVVTDAGVETRRSDGRRLPSVVSLVEPPCDPGSPDRSDLVPDRIRRMANLVESAVHLERSGKRELECFLRFPLPRSARRASSGSRPFIPVPRCDLPPTCAIRRAPWMRPARASRAARERPDSYGRRYGMPHLRDRRRPPASGRLCRSTT